MNKGTIAESMADAAQMGKEFIKLKQQLMNFASTVGSTFYPLFKGITTVIGGALKGLTYLIGDCSLKRDFVIDSWFSIDI